MNKLDEPLSELLTVPFTFRKQPSGLPADYRPHRRVSLLLLIVSRCHGNRANLEQIHVLDWACRSATSREHFLACMKGGRAPDLPCVRFDPTVNRAIDWASGANLLRTSTDSLPDRSRALRDYRIWLTTRGKAAVTVLDSIADCLVAEKILLAEIGRKVTQDFVQPFLRWGLSW